MNNTMWPVHVAEFMEQHWDSASHRRMFFIGSVNVKVAAMFQLLPDTETPDEARTVAMLFLQGMESGDHAEYVRCDKQAMGVYETWRRNRELH